MDHRPLVGAAVAAVLLGTAGCGMSQPPDDLAWQSSTVRVLEDVAGSVASSRLTLHEAQEGHLLGRSALVLAQDAESSAGGAVRGYLLGQPAPGRADEFRDVTALLHEAQGALGDARIALATGASEDYDDVEARLQEVREALDAAARPWRGADG